MTKDANAELTLEEALEEAEQQENESSSEESSTQEKDSREEEETSEETSEDTSLEGLDNDEDFQAAKKELEEEMGGKELTFNQTKRFRKTYWEAKEEKRQNEDLRTQLEQLQNKELSDNELIGESMKRGLLDQEKDPPAAKDEFDLENLYRKATPEQREWLDIIQNITKSQTKALQSKIDEYEHRFGDMTMSQKQQEISKEEDVLRGEVKERYGLDYDKDILPEIKKLIPELTKRIPQTMTLLEAGWTPALLAKQVIAERHMELAKKKVMSDTKKLNETKKRANLETNTAASTNESAVGDEDIEDILNEEMKKEGLLQFE